jgi:hypothetical protein
MQAEGPQRIADVLGDVLARYGYDVRPYADERQSHQVGSPPGGPLQQLELFEETGLAATA